MDKEVLKEELFNLIGYMITSARGLHEEPTDYRAFRMIDTTGRLLEIMESQGLLDPFLEELKDAIDDERFEAMNKESEIERLDAMVLKIADELQKRLD
jgi:hypothetical protein